ASFHYYVSNCGTLFLYTIFSVESLAVYDFYIFRFQHFLIYLQSSGWLESPHSIFPSFSLGLSTIPILLFPLPLPVFRFLVILSNILIKFSRYSTYSLFIPNISLTQPSSSQAPNSLTWLYQEHFFSQSRSLDSCCHSC